MNVITNISNGGISRFSIKFLVLSVIMVVFPEPGPARHMQGPVLWLIAWVWDFVKGMCSLSFLLINRAFTQKWCQYFIYLLTVFDITGVCFSM